MIRHGMMSGSGLLMAKRRSRREEGEVSRQRQRRGKWENAALAWRRLARCQVEGRFAASN